METLDDILARMSGGIGEATKGRDQALDALRQLILRRDDLTTKIDEATAALGEVFKTEPILPSDDQDPTRRRQSTEPSTKGYQCQGCDRRPFLSVQAAVMHGRRAGHKSGHEKQRKAA